MYVLYVCMYVCMHECMYTGIWTYTLKHDCMQHLPYIIVYHRLKLFMEFVCGRTFVTNANHSPQKETSLSATSEYLAHRFTERTCPVLSHLQGELYSADRRVASSDLEFVCLIEFLNCLSKQDGQVNGAINHTVYTSKDTIQVRTWVYECVRDLPEVKSSMNSASSRCALIRNSSFLNRAGFATAITDFHGYHGNQNCYWFVCRERISGYQWLPEAVHGYQSSRLYTVVRRSFHMVISSKMTYWEDIAIATLVS